MIELTKLELAKALYKGYYKRDLTDEAFNQITTSFKNKVKISKLSAKSKLRHQILNQIAYTNNPVVLHSGGVDSTIMLLLAREVFESKNITACSIGYKNHPIDESKTSELICKKLGINHITFYINEQSVQDTLDCITEKSYKDFFISSSLIPTFHIFKKAKDYGSSIITGDGGDELFCGYDRYLFAYYLSCFRNCGFFATKDFKNRKMQKVKKFLNGGYKDLVSIWGKEDIMDYLEKCSFDDYDFVTENIFEVNIRELEANIHTLDKMMLFDIGTELYGVETRKVETAVRMAGIEERKVLSPFLNWDIMNFAASLPIKYKYNNFTRKVLLREIIKDELPEYDKIVSKSKRGFAFPFIEEKAWTRLLVQNLLDKQILKIIG